MVVVVVVRGGGSGFQMKFLEETDFIAKKEKKTEGAYNNAQRTKGTLHQSSKPPSINTTPPNKGDKLRQGHPIPILQRVSLETVLCFRTRLHLTHIQSRQIRWATGRHRQL